MKKLIYIITSIFITTLSANTLATELSPYIVIKNVGENLFTQIANNQQEIEKFPDLMKDIVDKDLMPFVDYKYAAYSILGRNLSKTTEEQREKFVTSIRTYLVRTYATALAQYKDQEVIFEPEQDTQDKKIVSVSTKILDQNRPTINIIFQMRKNNKTREWKAFDMIVEGISLLSTKKAELSHRIAKQGVDQVTLELSSISK